VGSALQVGPPITSLSPVAAVKDKIDIEVTGTGTCEYSATSMAGTFKTNVQAEITISEQSVKKVAGGFFCPAEGKVDLVTLLFTTDGTIITPS
jgi:hypothetical protein